MQVQQVLIHIILSIILFLIINWIGKHSYSIGYMEVSIFVRVEEAPALNFLIRVLTPIIYIIVISTLFYYFKLDFLVSNIYLVNIYYIIFRLGFNLITNRGLLMNWYRQGLYWLTIITISIFTYEKLIKVKSNILPDFNTIANELWIIILIFLFQLTNNIRLSQDATLKRKANYLKRRYNHFARLYASYIRKQTNNEILEALIFTIMIFEDFNRPKVIRSVENMKAYFSDKEYTLGVMQVKSSSIISDYESVKLGVNKIITAHKKAFDSVKAMNLDHFDDSMLYDIVTDYNGGMKYYSEITELFSIIYEEIYHRKPKFVDR